jgi:hypothetical protein
MTEYLSIPQLLLENNILDKKYYSLWEKSLINVTNAIRTYWTYKDQVRKFADIIIDNDRMPIAKFISKDRLRVVFGKLLDIWTSAGTSGSYVDFFKAVFGEGVNVFISVPSPKVINLDISNFNLRTYLFMTENQKDKIITEQTFPEFNDKRANILFQDIIQNVSSNDMNAFLNTITPAGDYVNLGFYLRKKVES